MIFPQNIIALIWDFDKTLIPGYMEEPIFRHFKVDEKKFWEEVLTLPQFLKKRGNDFVSLDILWLNHLLAYVRRGIFNGLNNDVLRKLGGELEFYPGLPDFFPAIKHKIETEYLRHDIKVEHYIVSTGLRQMVLGSKIAPYANGVWGCEFIEIVVPPGYLEKGESEERKGEDENREIVDIGYALDNTTKTRAIFEINKGTNVVPEIDVNAAIKEEDRRVPVENMIYVADGPSDVPVFSVVNKGGGKTFAVYPKGAEREFVRANDLQKQGRVQSVGEADYTEGSKTYLWIMQSAREIAERIIRDRDRAVGDNVGLPPRHLSSL